MIKSVLYQDFQKHKRKKIKLDPHVTCIVGPTDTGKSSLFRGLRWLALNKPSTKWNRRKKDWKSKSTAVTGMFEKSKVTRRRKTGNEYVVNGKVFRAFKKDIPEDAQKVMKLDDSNFQCQLDGPLWFQLPPGQVAKKLNDIIDLSIIDRVQSLSNQKVREAETRFKVLKENRKKHKQDIQDTKWILQCKKDYEALESLKEEMNQTLSQTTTLGQLIQEYKDTEVKEWESVLQDILPVQTALKELKGLEKKISHLGKLIKEMKVVDPVLAKNMLKDFEQLSRFRNKADKEAELNRTLEMYVADINETLFNIEQDENKLALCLEQHKKQSKQRCPTCGNLLKQSR